MADHKSLAPTIPGIGVDPAYLRALMTKPALAPNDQLVPAEVCQDVIRQFTPFGHIGVDGAKKQTGILLGSYPREPHDPEVFTRAMVSVLQTEPAEIGSAAIDRLTRRLKHYPTRADLCEAIDEVKAERQTMVARARMHIEERNRRNQAKEADDRVARDKQALRDTLGKTWEDWWAIPIERRFMGSPEDFRKGWDKAKNKAKFCESWGAA